MPIYVYKCKQCEAVIEALQKISEQHPTTCPTCNTEMEKQVTSGAFCLMGYGWTKNGMNVTQRR